MAQMLEGFSGSLLASLKDVLVESNKLTLGKELGKGQYDSSSVILADPRCMALAANCY